MHNTESMNAYLAVYGQANFDGFIYPAVYTMNVYICWGNPLQTDKVNVMSDRMIFPFFYVGNAPNYDYLITINETTA